MSSNLQSMAQRIPGGWCKKRDIDLTIADFDDGSSKHHLSASLKCERLGFNFLSCSPVEYSCSIPRLLRQSIDSLFDQQEASLFW